MPLLSTHVDVCRGHDSCDPRPFVTYSPDVTAEGFQVTREGDVFDTHGCSKHSPHDADVSRGHPTVTANGLPVAYVGADVSCPSGVVDTGRPSVAIGEGGRIAWSR